MEHYLDAQRERAFANPPMPDTPTVTSATGPCESATSLGALALATGSAAEIAADLACALWEVSALRHGLFTPMQFRDMCARVIAAWLKQQNGRDEPRGQNTNNLKT